MQKTAAADTDGYMGGLVWSGKASVYGFHAAENQAWKLSCIYIPDAVIALTVYSEAESKGLCMRARLYRLSPLFKQWFC